MLYLANRQRHVYWSYEVQAVTLPVNLVHSLSTVDDKYNHAIIETWDDDAVWADQEVP